MILGSRFLLLILIVVLVGSYLWWRKEHPADRGASLHRAGPVPGKSIPDAELPSDIARWLDAGLLTRTQAAAIVSFEEGRVPRRRIPLFAEALGYIGAVLALAGGGVAIGQVWDDWTDLQHVGIVGATAIVAFAGGWLIRAQTEPALHRMMSVLWALSTGAAAATFGLFFVDVLDVSEDARALTIGGASMLYAGVLWTWHREVLQQAALFVTGLAATVGLLIALPGEPANWTFALVVWAYGIGWMLLGLRSLVAPAWSAMALGAVVGSFGPSMSGDGPGWLLGLGLASAAALMALGVSGRKLPLLAVGSIASFSYLTALVVRYFGDALGIPTALALVGIVVLALAILLGRGGTFRGGSWHHPTPGAA